MEILSFFVDRVDPERGIFLPLRTAASQQLTAIGKVTKTTRRESTQFSIVCLLSWWVMIIYFFFLATGISWTSFFFTPIHDVFFLSKVTFFFFLYFLFVNSTCGWLLLSAHLFPPELAAVVWPWLYRDCLSVSRWVGGFCFCAGYSLVCVCVLEPVFIKTDVSLFTPMPRLDELVSSVYWFVFTCCSETETRVCFWCIALPPLRFLTGWLGGYFNLRNQITRVEDDGRLFFFPDSRFSHGNR